MNNYRFSGLISLCRTAGMLRESATGLLRYLVPVVAMVLVAGVMRTEAASKQKGFADPGGAVAALAAAVREGNDRELHAIFGAGAGELISSGDPVSDRRMKEMFIRSYDQKNTLVGEGDRMVLVMGEKDWPFPIPLVSRGGKWFFDTKAGREEILNRRVGANELSAVQTLLAIADAQRDYAQRDRDSDRLPEYAQKLWSDPGKRNGLYWETEENERPSPLGELVAAARAEGYTSGESRGRPAPYHGYLFRILKRQGEHAAGGSLDYLDKGNMIRGFGVVAYPAVYGNSGVMTFMVSHDGVVYERDLGKNTAQTARTMKAFNPVPGWKKAEGGSR